MDPLCGIYDVSFLERRVGTLTVSISGLNTVFECRCSAGSSGEIQRLFCVSDGVPVAIGVLMPEGGGLHLRKRFTKNALMRLGLSSIESCFLSSASQAAQITPPDSACVWRTAAGHDLVFEDSALTASCHGRTDLLASGDPAQLLLAVPVETDAPFPLMPVFCFGDAAEIRGKDYVVFCLKNGKIIQSEHTFSENCT